METELFITNSYCIFEADWNRRVSSRQGAKKETKCLIFTFETEVFHETPGKSAKKR